MTFIEEYGPQIEDNTVGGRIANAILTAKEWRAGVPKDSLAEMAYPELWYIKHPDPTVVRACRRLAKSRLDAYITAIKRKNPDLPIMTIKGWVRVGNGFTKKGKERTYTKDGFDVTGNSHKKGDVVVLFKSISKVYVGKSEEEFKQVIDRLRGQSKGLKHAADRYEELKERELNKLKKKKQEMEIMQ